MREDLQTTEEMYCLEKELAKGIRIKGKDFLLIDEKNKGDSEVLFLKPPLAVERKIQHWAETAQRVAETEKEIRRKEECIKELMRFKEEVERLRDKRKQEVEDLNAEIERLNRVIANSNVDVEKVEKAAICSEMRNFYETRGATLRLRGEALSLAKIFYGLEESVGNDPYKERLANEHGKLSMKTKKLVKKYFTNAGDLRKRYEKWRNSNKSTH